MEQCWLAVDTIEELIFGLVSNNFALPLTLLPTTNGVQAAHRIQLVGDRLTKS